MENSSCCAYSTTISFISKKVWNFETSCWTMTSVINLNGWPTRKKYTWAAVTRERENYTHTHTHTTLCSINHHMTAEMFRRSRRRRSRRSGSRSSSHSHSEKLFLGAKNSSDVHFFTILPYGVQWKWLNISSRLMFFSNVRNGGRSTSRCPAAALVVCPVPLSLRRWSITQLTHVLKRSQRLLVGALVPWWLSWKNSNAPTSTDHHQGVKSERASEQHFNRFQFHAVHRRTRRLVFHYFFLPRDKIKK